MDKVNQPTFEATNRPKSTFTSSNGDPTQRRINNLEYRVETLENKNAELVEAVNKKKGTALSYGDDENEERGNWSGKLDFLLSCLGYAVGLGNVWRFPYLAYKNGGGAFFLPYFLTLFLIGMPIFLLELSLGQFTSKGCLHCWQFAPMFKGIGMGMVIVSGLVAIYYNVIIAWAWYYLFATFQKTLPWATCGAWSRPYCSTKLKKFTRAQCIANQNMGYVNNDNNGTCYLNGTIYSITNTSVAGKNNIKETLPSLDYSELVALQHKTIPGLHSIGGIRWDMTLCLLLAWVIIVLCLSKGIKSSGKVVYVTATFPYIVLIILFVNGLTLPGYEKGIQFYITPVWSRLLDGEVWKDAVVQIFFSLSASWGGLIVLASYNRFSNDVVRDTLVVTLGNCATSVFAGFVIFSYLGHFAHKLGRSVDTVVESGVTLAFVIYPAATITLPVPHLWSILFFLMLITLGMDSQFALCETVITAITDQFPKLRKFKFLVICGVAAVFFVLGLTMCTPGGPYFLTLMDDYSGGWNIMFISILECVSVCYVYGIRRFLDDIQAMVGKYQCCCFPWFIFKYWWASMWFLFVPLLMLVVMISSWILYKPSNMAGYVFPVWANALGWCMTFFVIVAILVTFIIQCARLGVRGSLTPTRSWGPAVVSNRYKITYVKNFVIDPHNKLNSDAKHYPMQGGPVYNSGFD